MALGIDKRETFDFTSRALRCQKKRINQIRCPWGFTKDIYNFLVSHQDKIPKIVSPVLEKNFPASIHEDILQAIGIDLEFGENIKGRRDPNFRKRILNAYEYSCAICGFNVRVGHSLVALAAEHIKWHQAGRPDSEENGVAL